MAMSVERSPALVHQRRPKWKAAPRRSPRKSPFPKPMPSRCR
jgi:hypothetical protein